MPQALQNNATSGVGRAKFGPDTEFNGVKIFSATMMAERMRLGETTTKWIEAHPQCEVRDAYVTQSSDDAFHCIAITLFYWESLDDA